MAPTQSAEELPLDSTSTTAQENASYATVEAKPTAKSAMAILPSELLLEIAEFMPSENDLVHLIKTCRHLYNNLIRLLYKTNVRQDEFSALIWSARRNLINVTKMSLDAGANVNTTSKGWMNMTALQVASSHGYLDIAKLLLSKGASLEMKHSYGLTALQFAVIRRHENIAMMLINRGADFHTRWPGDETTTTLHVAAALDFTPLVQFLIEKGADVNAPDLELETPLHWALKDWTGWASRGGGEGIWCNEIPLPNYMGYRKFEQEMGASAATIRLLLSRDANPQAEDSNGYTPQGLAMMKGNKTISKLFTKSAIVTLHEVESSARDILTEEQETAEAKRVRKLEAQRAKAIEESNNQDREAEGRAKKAKGHNFLGEKQQRTQHRAIAAREAAIAAKNAEFWAKKLADDVRRQESLAREAREAQMTDEERAAERAKEERTRQENESHSDRAQNTFNVNSGQPKRAKRSRGKCTVQGCGKWGHGAAQCWVAHPELRKKRDGKGAAGSS